MREDERNHDRSFSNELDPEEFQKIMSRIEDYLDFRQIIPDDFDILGAREASIPSLPSLTEFESLMHPLRMSAAPLRPSAVGGIHGIFRRFLNIPIRIYGMEQLKFNQKIQDLIGILGVYLRDLEHQWDVLRQLQEKFWGNFERLTLRMNEIETLQVSLDELIQLLGQSQQSRQGMNDLLDDVQGQVRSIETRIEEINSSIQRNEEEVKALDKWTKGNEEWAKALDKRTKGNEEWAKALDTRIKGNEDWARVLDVRMDGIEEWIRLVYGEVQSLALETRAMKGDKSAVFKKTKFVSPEDFATKLLAMEGNLKINIGSGHRILENYINIDYRELPGVDIVCDVTELPFAQNSIAELASSHLIEHFREYEFINRILPHWFSMIEEGGSIRVICPNWEAMMEKLNSGEMSLSRFKELTFGGQEYEGNDHFSMYTPKTLRDVLTGVGFEEPELIVVDRDNGGCPEMELLAKKPESDY